VKAEVRECEIVSISEETRENWNIREEATGEQYRFIFPGPRLSVTERDACRRCVTSRRPAPEYFVISGGLPGAVDPDFMASIIGDAKHMESRVIVDASGPALAAALDAGVFLAKPNLNELEDYVGTSLRSRAEIFSACQTLLAARKVEAVAVTMGAKGAMLVTRDALFEAPALQVAKQSEIGAGDSFLGTLVWALDSRHDLQTAFRFAMAAGAAALLAPGTQLSRRADVEQLVEGVMVLTQPLGNPSAI
jgi:6-phosphofructokinase 2